MNWLRARAREWTTWVGIAILAVLLVNRLRPNLGLWDTIIAPFGFVLTLLSDDRRFKVLEGFYHLYLKLHTSAAPAPAVAKQEDIHMTDISTSFYATLLSAIPPSAVRDLLTGNPAAAAKDLVAQLPVAAAQLPAPYGTAVQDIITEIQAPGFDNTTKTILDLVSVFSSLHSELETLRAAAAAPPAA